MTKHEYDLLQARVAHADKLYRSGAETPMTDAQFDACVRQLRAAEKEHHEWKSSSTITSTVGSDLTPGFRKVGHSIPMLSIDDVFEKTHQDYSEVYSWYASVIKELGYATELTVEPKLDGCAASCVYDGGVLQRVVTRGDGKVGDDITENGKQIEDIPCTVLEKGAFEVRGEIVMHRDDFGRINEQRIANGEKPFANPRNLVAGTIKTLDPQTVKNRCLHFVAHGVVLNGELLSVRDSKCSAYLDRQFVLCPSIGMDDSDTMTAENYLNRIREALTAASDQRKSFAWDTDGAVVKVACAEDRKKLGCTSRAPRWACALKFRPEQAETTVKDIVLQIGRTGVITPVAVFEPTPLSGSVVARATLHNQDEINRIGVRVGAKVLIEKSGEIIPAVVSVTDPGSEPAPFDIIKNTNGVCPCCGELLVRDEGFAAIKCPNRFCRGKLKGQLQYLCSRPCLDISNIGEVAVEALVESGAVTKLLDIFRMDKATLLKVTTKDGRHIFGESVANKIMASMEKARTAPFSKWLTALGIPGVGKVQAEKLAHRFSGFSDLLDAGVNVRYIVGNVVGNSIVRWFMAPETDENILTRLPALGINPSPEKDYAPGEGCLKGEVVVITGTLSKPRSEIEKMIIDNGGVVAKNVSKKTTILLAGDSPGSKLAKAEQMELDIISEEDLEWMLKQGSKTS